LSTSGLDFASSWESVSEARRVKIAGGVVHVLAAPTVLACTHKLAISSTIASAVLPTLNALFVDDSHAIEIVVSKVEVLPHFVLHVLSLTVFDWQLFDLETILVVADLVSHPSRGRWLASRLALVIGKRNLRVALLR